ncbi:MerR family transcriptional regulator [Microvirga arsenatis]|uniref:MerR family transcriptional regulator n=1 Tax=Microvirga arsenatis TaxID=2692265 RepID=A0ABW9YTC3_9HYPH|nr:MerR family transcriptional regulator [Microvirga arsenatis]NBJ12419.1 MerR family transcriptional regulator [Microvirga arsenatis]NBJ23295.1 MerR family transcriptional regulator [Microvirga arsenatis]
MDKSPDAFRTISEVAEELDVPQHVLRFWETRFNHIKPLKRGGGRRYYRPDDVDLLKGIRHLLYGEGYTIKGVQRILKEEGVRFVQGIGRGEQSVLPPHAEPAHEVDEGGSAGSSADAEAADPPASSPGQALAPDARRELRAALEDLYECDRVLRSLRDMPDQAPGD